MGSTARKATMDPSMALCRAAYEGASLSLDELAVQRYLDLTVDRHLRFRLRRRGFLRLRATGWSLCLDTRAARLRAWW